MAVRYTTAQAFRAALKDRFAALVRADPRLRVGELQRQFAYDRVLGRCFSGDDAERWVLKGAGALLARLDGIARHSRDIDLYYAEQAAGVGRAVDALVAAVDRDLGDHFRFEVTRTSALQEEAKGSRAHLDAYLGARFATFHVDVVVATTMTGEPEEARPLTAVEIDGLVRPAYRVFPLADHIADKVCAIIERHDRADGTTAISSRVKDLVDIAIIARTQQIRGPALRHAIATGAINRGILLPREFAVPDVAAWSAGYARLAADMPGSAPTFDEAVELAHRLLDPVLVKLLDAVWDPTSAQWHPEPGGASDTD